jgi:hypothetical protein
MPAMRTAMGLCQGPGQNLLGSMGAEALRKLTRNSEPYIQMLWPAGVALLRKDHGTESILRRGHWYLSTPLVTTSPQRTA